ncbi:MAG: heme-dependent oxidative N-demethylase subunit alpha family protein [Candidatus Sericytochromatia bacterium]
MAPSGGVDYNEQMVSASEPDSHPARPVCHGPVLRYAPFASGTYTMSPGLRHLQIDATDPARRLVQLDAEYPLYRANKQAIRASALARHVGTQGFDPATRQAVFETLIGQLCAAYPAYFRLEAPGRLHCLLSGEELVYAEDYTLAPHSVYADLWDALASQIQEDLAVWQLRGEHDSLSALHVCAPNGWDPAAKLGLSFDQIHAPVPGMERQRAHYLPLLKGLIHKPAFCRFIWDLRTCPALNHHPLAAQAPPFDPADPVLYVRVERQLLYGLPSCAAVLFLIRTYCYPVRSLDVSGLVGLERALAGMPPEMRAYKQLARDAEAICAWLQALIRAA